MESEKGEDFVNVGIRVRPHLKADISIGESIDVISSTPGVIYVVDKTQKYSFDHVFPQDASQEQVYDDLVKPLVDNVVNGYNSTVFAYGQTGTGKTYTMGSNPELIFDENSGIISRALRQMCGLNFSTVHISFLEIYNDKVFDLLKKVKVPLLVKGFKVSGLEKVKIESWADGQTLLYAGGKNRHTGETKQNLNSSRSHAIFIIYCKTSLGSSETEAKFNLVDLAGSESIKRTGNEGHQMSEGISINRGLLSIGKVINALSCDQQFIPYRESTITTILQDSLNKKNFVTLLACISPNMDDAHETVQTLDFAQRAKKVKSRPELNNKHFLYSKNSSVARYNPTPKPYSQSAIRTKLFSKTPYNYRTNGSISTIKKQPLHSTQIDENMGQNPYDFSIMNTSSASSIQNYNATIQLKQIQSLIEAAQNNIIKQIKETENRKNAKSIVDKEFSKLRRKTLAYQPDNCVPDDSFIDFQKLEDDNKENQSEDSLIIGDTRVTHIETQPDAEGSPVFKIPGTPEKFEKRMTRKSTKLKTSSPITKIKPRRSMRLISRQTKVWEKSPSPVKPETIKNHRENQNVLKRQSKRVSMKPAANEIDHTKHVLHILNYGSMADIQKLSTIGPKSALMLRNYREFKGKFENISDLRKVPWRGASYNRFLEMNFLVET